VSLRALRRVPGPCASRVAGRLRSLSGSARGSVAARSGLHEQTGDEPGRAWAPAATRQAFAADLERLFSELEQMEPELLVVAGAGGEAAAASVLLDDSRINRLILQARPAPRPLRLARRRCPAPGRVACVLLPCRPGEVLL